MGDEAAAYLKGVLASALRRYPKIIVATHIPPFYGAARYQGRPSADDRRKNYEAAEANASYFDKPSQGPLSKRTRAVDSHRLACRGHPHLRSETAWSASKSPRTRGFS